MKPLCVAAAFGALISLSVIEALASNYPSRPVELIVPFAASGSSDVIARIVGQVVSERWGQSVVVLDKPGATGEVGSEYVSHAAPDGYTLLAASASTHTMLPAFRSDLPYNTMTAFDPVTLLAAYPNMLVVNPNRIQATTVSELIDLLKKDPDKYTCASSGTGGSSHFACELFKLKTKTRMIHVPYKGSGPAMADLLAGNVDLIFDNMSTVWPQVVQGRLRALGVCGPSRTTLAPNVPAIAETIPGFEVTSWLGIVAPAGTPKPVINTIAANFRDAIATPEVQKQLAVLGATAISDTPQAFAEFIYDDFRKWQDVALKAHIQESK